MAFERAVDQLLQQLKENLLAEHDRQVIDCRYFLDSDAGKAVTQDSNLSMVPVAPPESPQHRAPRAAHLAPDQNGMDAFLGVDRGSAPIVEEKRTMEECITSSWEHPTCICSSGSLGVDASRPNPAPLVQCRKSPGDRDAMRRPVPGGSASGIDSDQVSLVFSQPSASRPPSLQRRAMTCESRLVVESSMEAERGCNVSGRRPKFDLWPEFRGLSAQESHRPEKANNSMESQPEVFDNAKSAARAPVWMWHPGSKFRIAWDMAGSLLLVYDIIVLPVQVAFDVDDEQAVKVFIMTFWLLDMLSSFTTGFLDESGRTVMDPVAVVKRYLSTWFIADLFVVALDWVPVLIGESSSPAQATGILRIGKLMRFLRILRILRLVRLAKLRAILTMVNDFIDSDYLATVLVIAKSLIFIVAANHFIACAWFALGNSSFGGEPGWVHEYGLETAAFPSQYAFSLHWSLTQFTPASMSVQPQNLMERVFAIIIVLFALIIFSSFVSSVTSSMTSLRNMKASQDRHSWLLRKYMREVGISNGLQQRVNRYVAIVLEAQRRRVQQSEVVFLNMLSAPLKLEVHYELYEPVISTYPFFSRLKLRNVGCLGQICHRAVHEDRLSKGDVLFTSGQEAVCMYFLKEGSLAYQLKGQEEFRNIVTACQAQSFVPHFCEHVLWTFWPHPGTMQAKSECSMLTLASKTFREAISSFPAAMSLAQRFGTELVLELNEGKTVVSDVRAEFHERSLTFLGST